MENSTTVNGELFDPALKSSADIAWPEFDPLKVNLPKFTIKELMGHTFILPREDGQRLHTEIV